MAPLEQRLTQYLFQLADLSADGGLRDEQFLGRKREALEPSRDLEASQCRQRQPTTLHPITSSHPKSTISSFEDRAQGEENNRERREAMWKQIVSILMDAIRLVTFTSDDKDNRRHGDY
jgi:hypothetical protein